MPAVEERSSRSSHSPTDKEVARAINAFRDARGQMVSDTRAGLNYVANQVYGKNTEENRDKVRRIILLMLRRGTLDRFDIGGQDHFRLLP